MLHRRDQLRRHVDLTHTHGVNPEHVPVRHGLLHLGTVPPEPLGKSLPPIPPTPHLEKVIGSAETEEKQEQDVVGEPHLVKDSRHGFHPKRSPVAKGFSGKTRRKQGRNHDRSGGSPFHFSLRTSAS